MNRAHPFRHYDLVLLGACLALISLGILLIYSGTLSDDVSSQAWSHPVARQFIFALLGGGMMVGASMLDYRFLGRFALLIYLGSLLLLLVVLVIGDETLGSRRWITMAGFQIQPSEAAKLALIIMLGQYFSERRESVRTARVFLTSLAIALPPAALVLVEPDLGSAIIMGVIWLGMALIAGVRLRYLSILTAAFLLALPFMFLGAITDYQKERIALFLNPESDPFGGGFNIIQSQIAIGSGRLFGKGLTDGLQTQNDFVNTQATDYIFSVLGEELGFLGGLFLLGLFAVVLFRALGASAMARDGLGELIPAGIATMVLAQVVINIGVNLGIFPVTGITLPFISQGGSSLAMLLIGIGIIQSIRIRHRDIEFQ